MAITKETEISKIEIVNNCIIQVRTDTVVKEDGVEISRSMHRHSLVPCGYDGTEDWNWTDTDVSGEDLKVQAVANAVWTNDVKTAYKAKIEAQG
tara:strand:+ start:183 stop:464 length:282 start_codon:yes stop_codon:yes gene_type:complete